MGGDIMMVSEKEKRILVAEDEPSIRRLVRFFLESVGYDVDEAEDGEKALKKALSSNYSLIILDLMMPGLDGWGFLKRYKESGGNAHVIVLSARDLDEDFRKGAEMSVSDYFVKPFDPEELVDRVKSLLGES